MLVKNEMTWTALTVLAGLQLGSDLPVLNEVPAHDRDAPAQFSAVCSCTQAFIYFRQQQLLHNSIQYVLYRCSGDVTGWTLNSKVQSRADPLSCSDPRQIIHMCLRSSSSINWYWPRSEAGKVTTGLAESNGGLLLGLWLTSPQRCLSTIQDYTLTPMKLCPHVVQNSILICSLAILDPRAGHTMDVLSPLISILCHSDWLFHRQSCHKLMLSIQAVHGLPSLHTPCIVPCLALFLSPVNSLVSSWCDHSMLASLLWQCLTVPSLLQLC